MTKNYSKGKDLSALGSYGPPSSSFWDFTLNSREGQRQIIIFLIPRVFYHTPKQPQLVMLQLLGLNNP